MAKHSAFPMPRGHLPGLDAVPAHGLPCLRMCGGEQSSPLLQSKKPFWLWKAGCPWLTCQLSHAGDVSQAIGCGNPTLHWLFQTVCSLQSKKPFWLWKAGCPWLTCQLSHAGDVSQAIGSFNHGLPWLFQAMDMTLLQDKNLQGCGDTNSCWGCVTQAISCGNHTLHWLFHVVFSLQSKKPFGLWKTECPWLTCQLSHAGDVLHRL